MKELKDKDPSYYQSEVKWEKDAIENFSKAIECIKHFDTEKIPILKLRSLVDCYNEFAQNIPEDVDV